MTFRENLSVPLSRVNNRLSRNVSN